jgi:hypothetical protein
MKHSLMHLLISNGGPIAERDFNAQGVYVMLLDFGVIYSDYCNIAALIYCSKHAAITVYDYIVKAV